MRRGVCGQYSPLPTTSFYWGEKRNMGDKTVEINEANFDADVLQSDKPVLIDFWATWCGPCRREMPEFQQAHNQFNDDGFEILAVSFDDTFEAIATFRDEFNLTFPLALDDTGEINDTYGIQTRPSSFLLDKDGTIIMRHFGMMTEEQIQGVLTEALANE